MFVMDRFYFAEDAENELKMYLICSLDLNFLASFGYLVPADLTVGQLLYVVRKRIKLSAEKAIFVFTKNTLSPTGR